MRIKFAALKPFFRSFEESGPGIKKYRPFLPYIKQSAGGLIAIKFEISCLILNRHTDRKQHMEVSSGAEILLNCRHSNWHLTQLLVPVRKSKSNVIFGQYG